jgi:hypothetical protein
VCHVNKDARLTTAFRGIDIAPPYGVIRVPPSQRVGKC